MFKIRKKAAAKGDELKLKKAEKNIKKEKNVRVPSARETAVIAFLNRYSLLFHVLLACGICFVIEWVSRHSFLSACGFVIDRNLAYLYNSLLVFTSLLLVYTVKRRALLRMIISVFWLFLGIINGCILAKRVSPFSFTDIKMVGDLFTMESNYFTDTEALMVIIGVGIVVLFLVWMWFKGPKYQGQTHRLLGLAATLVVVFMIPGVTDAAVSSNILTDYFENLAQGYKDYGFVYSFSSSVLDRGMSVPEDYSEEAVEQVLETVGGKKKITEHVLSSGSGQSSESASNDASALLSRNGIGGCWENGGSYAETPSKDVQKMKAAEPEDIQKLAAVEPSEMRTQAAALAKSQTVKTAAAEEEKLNTAEPASESGIPKEEGEVSEEYPNIICILLESFIDPEMIRFLELSGEAVPNFHYLYDNFTSGYLEVPVVGAGTANTEFEVLTGMGMQFFGLGEYPYKTILKETNCESIASDLHQLGYGTHVVHNNGGNFYSRANAFSMMGFDTFTSKELMDIQDYTPIGTWPTDDILIGEVEKSLDYTPDQPDFVYTITVEGHGDYPREKVLENPAITVSGVEDEGMRNAWEYYVNMIHEVDDFIGDLIEMLEQRDEKTMVVMFGDHLPTMNLTEEDMRTGSLFQTQYATWNNFGLEKQDKNMASYQLLADMLNDLGLHEGTMFTFHQKRYRYDDEAEYLKAMELLQYDILYGDHYVYGGGNPYPASDLVMGTQEVVIHKLREQGDYFFVSGENFTKWSKVFINGSKVSTTYISSRLLRFKSEYMPEGSNEVAVNQMGSSDTVFRSSNTVLYEQLPETETETESESETGAERP